MNTVSIHTQESYVLCSVPSFLSVTHLSYLQSGRPEFDPCIGKIPWRREWLPTPILWPGDSFGLQSMGWQRVGHDWVTFTVTLNGCVVCHSLIHKENYWVRQKIHSSFSITCYITYFIWKMEKIMTMKCLWIYIFFFFKFSLVGSIGVILLQTWLLSDHERQ